MDQVQVFAPASVANVGCGYDTIGFAIDGLGDEITISKRSDDQLLIKDIIGANLPKDAENNVATIAIRALLKQLGSPEGFDVTIKKLFKPGSGLGSSASSSAGAVFGVNELLGRPFSKDQLLPFAMEGEAFASKCYHADNVAPSLLGGFNVIRSYQPLDLFKVSTPDELRVLIIFPDVVIKTAESKQLLPKSLEIATARNQWANVAGLIQALNTSDFDLLARSVEDFVAEPVRKSMIPKYDEVKTIVGENGAVGFNISGSGPSMFAFFSNENDLNQASKAIETIYKEIDLKLLLHSTKINTRGCETLYSQ